MATRKQDDDLGQAEVQKTVDKAESKGHIGFKPSGIDNREFSLLTGPDSPTVAEQRAARKED